MAETRAQSNRRIRQEALREQLEKGGHIQHVLEISDQLRDLDTDLDPTQVTRLKASADIKNKIIDKYLASMKASDIEVTGANGDPLDTSFNIKIIRPE